MKLIPTLFLGAMAAGFAGAQSTGEYHLSGPFTHQNLTIPFEIGSGYFACGGLCEGNDSVVQEQVDVVSVDGSFANLVDLFRIEAYAPQFAVQRENRSGSYRQRLRCREAARCLTAPLV